MILCCPYHRRSFYFSIKGSRSSIPYGQTCPVFPIEFRTPGQTLRYGRKHLGKFKTPDNAWL